jgi:hypothetical protein
MEASPHARPTGAGLAEKAIASAIETWTKMKPLVISAALASGVVGAIFSIPAYGFGSGVEPARLWITLLQAPFQAAIGAPLAVAVHRLVLKGEVTPGFISLNRPYQWLFFVWLCAFALVQFAVVGVRLVSGLAALIFAAGWFIFFIKSALIFPAIAIEAPSGNWRERIDISWKQMDGNFWLLFRALIVSFLPLIIATVLGVIAGILVGIILAIGGAGTVVEMLVMRVIITAVVQPASVMLAAGVASWLYLWVIDNPTAQAQSAQTATSTVT